MKHKHSRNQKITCPECKEASEGKMRFRPECQAHFDLYFCEVCNNEWDPAEVLIEEYKVARFMGRDGDWKFVRHTESNQRRLRENTNMWNPEVLNTKRDTRGRYTGKMSRKDSNLLKRLKRK